jgi:hypothetical protein
MFRTKTQTQRTILWLALAGSAIIHVIALLAIVGLTLQVPLKRVLPSGDATPTVDAQVESVSPVSDAG